MVYGWVLTVVNLPEEWGYLVGGGIVIGLLTANWYGLLGALAVFALLFDQGPEGRGELVALLFFIYLPGAALSIAVGIATRRALSSVRRRRRPNRT